MAEVEAITARSEVAVLAVGWTLAHASKRGCLKPRKGNASRSAGDGSDDSNENGSEGTHVVCLLVNDF